MRKLYYKVLIILNNGEYIIIAVTAKGEYYKGRYNSDEGWGYDLGFVVDGSSDICNLWSEGALRKKYPPSNLSFNQLIKECKSNVVY